MKYPLTVAAILVPTLHTSLALSHTCQNGPACPAGEYCSPFSERCEDCQDMCDSTSHNYHENDCRRYCPAYETNSLTEQIHALQRKYNLLFILVMVLLCIVLISHVITIVRWLKKKRSVALFLKNLTSKKEKNAKEHAGTICNVMHTTGDAERPPSQIFSVTGMEGSTVLTVTTPVSTRYPAEDSTNSTEYSYDNAGLQVTPSSNKPPFPQTSY